MPLPRTGANTEARYHPMCNVAGWAGRRYHLAKYKEVFDAVLYALYRALKR